ncbi:hypothetical protein FC83_GL002136 [Agrilactobacillus composti DSM 18527 = JCM 14202]|uniref:Uncharacterized protein n=1 Tax=Agrilactobacillus composti DSM 18527 = JCM 14202 TaxID=1423734 RepID=X0PT68_9LACO|nr:hypothetical protein [Agrilactobacillus composti]KRM34650.1 hypothetical protein FC83_GL002136 [Agrilactobacillus composti DSM 18527 = JCM 14202]GAF41182.1 hypothetical protein JCM14202_3110 [Agrilactobacillus composti DSM 18527 = JCM 14202]
MAVKQIHSILLSIVGGIAFGLVMCLTLKPEINALLQHIVFRGMTQIADWLTKLI